MDILPNTIGGWMSTIMMVIMVAYVALDKGIHNKRRESDELDDKLIERFKEINKDNEERMKKLQISVNELTTRVKELEADNKKFIDIFQGRDENSKKFYEEGFKTAQITVENNALIKGVDKKIDILLANAQVK